MKYIFTEQQLSDFKAKMQYTPEKIDEFVVDAQKCAEYLKKIYEKYYADMLALSIGDVMENSEPLRLSLEKLAKEKTYVDKLSTKWYNAIEMYTVGEYPDNVTKLDKLYDIIDHLQTDIDNLASIFQSVYDSVTHFKEGNQKKFE